MTTTQTAPTFIQTPAGLACPAPGCNRTYIYKAAAEKHWTANHQPSPNGHTPEVDPFDLDHLRALADEVEHEKAEQHDEDEERDDLDGSTLYVDEDDDEHVCDTGDFDRTICADPCGEMHSYCSTCGTRQDSCAHDPASPATDNGIRLLTPDQVLERTTHHRLDVDAVLALSDATTGLVDAITRLVGIGYARDEARVIVLDLIAKLDGRPA